MTATLHDPTTAPVDSDEDRAVGSLTAEDLGHHITVEFEGRRLTGVLVSVVHLSKTERTHIGLGTRPGGHVMTDGIQLPHDHPCQIDG